MEDEPDDAERTRPPLMGDLVGICRELNQRSVNYIVIGGMAINIHGFTRNTEDIDLLIETEETNERKILEVLSLLPDGAAKELRPGEVAKYVVVRVCDDITVDLMAKACGHDYESAKGLISLVVVDGVTIPFASPILLWKTKQTFREKDQIDQLFLRKLLEDRGEWPVV
ncbi:MAG: hypothetical protein JHD23_01480 [Akkermansiaceae bacterium]|jgi:hypothetical protein|nr:hypothetical protein [Akkermansiaceae bacterium]MBJ7423137.1 hypothetical protein [Akkermansiaceae bacterium]